MLTFIFSLLIIISIAAGLATGNVRELTEAVLNEPVNAVELCIYLCGGMCFWGGLMRVAEKSGLTERLAEVFKRGCGDGYYSVLAARNCDVLFGFDLSKTAVEHAAKRARAAGIDNTLFSVASVYALPVGDAVCDTVLSVFAPCAEAEYFRILRPGGRLILAAAGRDHLAELKAVLYHEVHENTERRDLPSVLRPVGRETLSYRRTLNPDALHALYLMTPYCRRTAREAAERLFALPELTVTFSFDLSVYER